MVSRNLHPYVRSSPKSIYVTSVISLYTKSLRRPCGLRSSSDNNDNDNDDIDDDNDDPVSDGDVWSSEQCDRIHDASEYVG